MLIAEAAVYEISSIDLIPCGFQLTCQMPAATGAFPYKWRECFYLQQKPDSLRLCGIVVVGFSFVVGVIPRP